MTPPGIVHYTEVKKYDMIMAPEQVQIFATILPDGKKPSINLRTHTRCMYPVLSKSGFCWVKKQPFLNMSKGPSLNHVLPKQYTHSIVVSVTVCVPQYQFVID